MIRTASNLSTAVINDQRAITVTGRIIGVIPFGNKVRLDVLVDADTEIEVHAQEVAK